MTCGVPDYLTATSVEQGVPGGMTEVECFDATGQAFPIASAS